MNKLDYKDLSALCLSVETSPDLSHAITSITTAMLDAATSIQPHRKSTQDNSIKL